MGARRLAEIHVPAWKTMVATIVAMGLLYAFAGGTALAEVAGKAEFVHGDVSAQQGSQASRNLAKGADIYDQDMIQTAADARVQLRFTDGSMVALMPETNFSVMEYRLGEQEGADGSLVFSLLRGGLRTVTGAIGKTNHEAYELKTPVGSLGIRGTEYTAVLNPADTLRVHVGRGKIVLSNDWGVQEVNEGQFGLMTLGAAPELSDSPVDAAAGGLQAPEAAQNDTPELELPLILPEPGTEPGGQPSPPINGGSGGSDPGCGDDCPIGG